MLSALLVRVCECPPGFACSQQQSFRFPYAVLLTSPPCPSPPQTLFVPFAVAAATLCVVCCVLCADRAPGFGVSLVAETTQGCLFSAQVTAKALQRPEDVGELRQVRRGDGRREEVKGTGNQKKPRVHTHMHVHTRAHTQTHKTHTRTCTHTRAHAHAHT